jgi:hypothetical protein
MKLFSFDGGARDGETREKHANEAKWGKRGAPSRKIKDIAMLRLFIATIATITNLARLIRWAIET